MNRLHQTIAATQTKSSLDHGALRTQPLWHGSTATYHSAVGTSLNFSYCMATTRPVRMQKHQGGGGVEIQNFYVHGSFCK